MPQNAPFSNALGEAHVFKTRDSAESAVRLLGHAGIDLKHLSLIGKGYHSEEHPVGFYTLGDRIKTWGGNGAFWGAVFGILAAPAMILFPGIGVVAFAGPVVSTVIAALEGAVAVGGLSALGAALTQVGLKREDAVRYESAILVDEFVLLVHGDVTLQARANAILAGAPVPPAPPAA
ncbi:DUF1269 domain-containing protein [Curvibacter sp. HBC61]|uniref:DUF1269 domain-containing protein n=1 Tax=Curvibacter cyanobacteriorum TaxID=3026422 RepID=A0ABT5MXF4_9BURK|nr:DUF1269 domain-containing protein [Curvibacter sp. HBC61]MDD0838121.1 DUF1269 domain-containing protein [Curvibacter sp. HBC61]